MTRKPNKVPVTMRALVQRINRKLKPDLQQLKATRGDRQQLDWGHFYIMDYRNNWVKQGHINAVALAKELECLHPWEMVVD
jgi:hypothetical protein